ncbi:hypothetical protein RIR_jg38453.t1 [Rhizophagus irregularis DAOM 181602=DAOM 197198]|nr:hypothetical protein RIR_jg38453.t1 [Rhizophagus irregularis DAOM 181602=DAOM 197198]
MPRRTTACASAHSVWLQCYPFQLRRTQRTILLITFTCKDLYIVSPPFSFSRVLRTAVVFGFLLRFTVLSFSEYGETVISSGIAMKLVRSNTFRDQ